MKRRRMEDDEDVPPDIMVGSYTPGFERRDDEPVPEKRPIGFVHFPDPPDPLA